MAHFLRPQSSGAHYNLGYALQRNGRLDEAIVAYRKASDLQKDYAEPYRGLGASSQHKQGKSAEAIGLLQLAIKMEPDSAASYYELGVALLNQRKLAEASRAAFRKVIELKLEWAEGYISLGAVLRDQQNLAEAEAAILQGHRTPSPSGPNPLPQPRRRLEGPRRIWRRRRPPSAKAIALDPDFAKAYYALPSS